MKLRNLKEKGGEEEEKILDLQLSRSVWIHQKAMELTQICLPKIETTKTLRVFQIDHFSGENLLEK